MVGGLAEGVEEFLEGAGDVGGGLGEVPERVELGGDGGGHGDVLVKRPAREYLRESGKARQVPGVAAAE